MRVQFTQLFNACLYLYLDFNDINATEMLDTENQDPNINTEVNGDVVNGEDGHADEVPTKTIKDKTTKESTKPPAQKVKITYEKYRNIANMLVLFMRQEEDKTITEGKYHLYLQWR